MSEKRLSLGLEFSTQSVKLLLLDIDTTEVIYKAKFDYDDTFPKYRSRGGVLPHPADEIRHTSPFLLIEALDHAFRKLMLDEVPVQKIRIIKVDAMQHCTVYAGSGLKDRLRSLDPSLTLLDQVGPALTRKTSPIWEDRSTEKETDILNEISGNKISDLTGNKSETRFPAAQILKWAVQDPGNYCRTSHIFILSAFLTSILTGSLAPVDTGDGWGSNLNSLDIEEPGWNKRIIDAFDTYLEKRWISSSLKEKLGEISHYDSTAGRISDYFVKRYGFNRDTVVLIGTGDNPATLLGAGGQVVVSLGSSYTINGIMKKIIPSSTGEYNIFGYTRGKAMALCCFTNGAKLHDHFLKKYINSSKKCSSIKASDWDKYVRSAGDPLLSEGEKLMLPYLLNESVPFCKKGIIRAGFSEADGSINIRALHISQVLSLFIHSPHLDTAGSVCIVGGGGKNIFMRQLISDAFNANSYMIRDADYAASLGCAVSGARNILKITYKEAIKRFIKIDPGSLIKPNRKNLKSINKLNQRYKELEKQFVNQRLRRF
ncbi:MAG: hypothetical protein KKH98_05080 [Spirochaetes bacterium]|nr:hypothetical protein [Spirochaetota bacterium]